MLEFKFNHVDEKKYNRLLSKFNQGTQEYIKVSFNDTGDIKKRTNIDNNETSWTKKQMIKTLKQDLFDINVIQQTSINQPDIFNSTFEREKLQNHYKIGDYDLYLSKTLVKNKNNINNQYEIELNASNVNEDLNVVLENLLMTMNDTNMVYTENEKEQLIKDCDQYHLKLIEPQNINLNDVKEDNQWMVSTKAKGQRKMLIIHTTGVWLINPPDYNLLIRYDEKEGFDYFINSWNLTVFDGSLIVPMNKTEYEFNYLYWYLCYDCLVFNKQDMRNQDYIERIDKCKTFWKMVTRYINPDFLTFALQTTRVIDYKTRIHEILELQKTLNYQHNGLIFTPLGQYQNLYKYNISDITFDLSIYETGTNQVELYAYDPILNKDVSINNIINNNILQESFDRATSKKIGECRWDQEMSKMVLVKIRDDKTKPDNIETIIENWKNVNDPLMC